MPASTLQLFAVCVLIWGTTWLAITFQLGEVAPEMSVAYRFLLASAVLFAYCRWRGHALAYNLKQHADLALLGASMFCIGYLFVYYAEIYIVSGMVAVGFSTSPMINMFAARIFFGTRIPARVATASVLGVAGIACVFWPEFGRVSAAGSVVATRNHKLGYGIWSSLAWGMLYGGAFSLLIGMALGQGFTFLFTGRYVLSLMYLACFGSIVTFACYLTLIARIGAARSAYTGVMVPIVALIVSFLFENFAWNWLTSLGVALSVLGNVVMLRPARA
jgi:drug/metabolite transporter (DMT)-like permease